MKFYINIRIRTLLYILNDMFFRFLWIFNRDYKSKNKIFFHCFNNLGDNIQNIIFLNKLSELYPNFLFFYGVQKNQIIELQRFVENHNLKILPVNLVRYDSYDLWKNRFYYWTKSDSKIKYNYYKFFLNFYSKVCKTNKFKKVMFKKYHLFSSIRDNKKFSKYDILFINSKPTSNQLTYNETSLDNIISETHKHYKIITTKKIENIPCTLDLGLSLYEIVEIPLIVPFVLLYVL